MTDYINETNENNLKKILIKYIKILNNKIIENKREGLIIYGFNYIPEFINNKYNKEYLKYLDFKYYLKNINILIIYNENFKDYIDNSIYQGQGNALLRKFRSDNINTITKRKESNVKASILGIPTGFYHYYNKLTNNINTNDPSVFNNEIKCEIIKSIIKIFIYILENEDIKYVFYSAAILMIII